ncbi:MAG TPA: hypothetical protein VHO48_00920, partial [Anaerolineaceae bacterium]|nr:hypothetical protein [Anaerolineaceae bacterium]
WAEACLFFGLGLGLVIAPWVARNYTLTGKLVFDQSTSQSIIFGQRYSLTANDLPATQPGESTEQFSARMMESARRFALQHPVYTARFIAAHFLNNEVATLAVLPFYLSLDDYRDTLLLRSVFWTDIFTRLTWQEGLLLVIYLALTAVGVGVSWQRLGVAGLVPLVLNLAYSLSNAVARNSGWRYILPVDWVALFYVSVGLLGLVGWLLGRPVASVPSNPDEPLSRFPWGAAVGLAAGLLTLGAVIPLAEKVFPVRFPDQSRAELASALAERVVGDPARQVEGDLLAENSGGSNMILLHGLAFYPRYYNSGQGESGSGWPIFGVREGRRLAFILVGPEGNQQVLLALDHEPDIFPNASEILIMGCRPADQQFIQAKWVVRLGEPDQVFISPDQAVDPCP